MFLSVDWPDGAAGGGTEPLVDAVRIALGSKAPVAVAFSGGRDSTGLLHATLQVACAVGVEVHALHVDHALQAESAAWARHGKSLCERWRAGGWPVRFHARRLDWRPSAGESLEAAARQQRYCALVDLAHAVGCRTVLLAHHRDDQVETFLLQALRGAGVAGLSAMPAVIQRAGVQWLRPWLGHARREIEAYAQRHGLDCVDDPSNGDPRHARNRLRLAVLPALRHAFPHADGAFQAAAAHAQDAASCLAALAESDLTRVSVDAASAAAGSTANANAPALRVAEGLALGGPRWRNLLRHWLLTLGAPAPSAALLGRLSHEVGDRPMGHWRHTVGVLSLHRGCLHWRADAALPTAAEVPEPIPDDMSLGLEVGANPLPAWGGVLWVEPVAAAGPVRGVGADALATVTLRPRRGGERFQSHPAGIPRGLKKQYQSAGVAPWQRTGPLIYRGEHLLWVPGLGVDARHVSPDGVVAHALRWEPNPG